MTQKEHINIFLSDTNIFVSDTNISISDINIFLSDINIFLSDTNIFISDTNIFFIRQKLISNGPKPKIYFLLDFRAYRSPRPCHERLTNGSVFNMFSHHREKRLGQFQTKLPPPHINLFLKISSQETYRALYRAK